MILYWYEFAPIISAQNKCTKYWPALGENPMLFNDRYLVESTKCDEEESYRLTHLTLQNLEVSLS